MAHAVTEAVAVRGTFCLFATHFSGLASLGTPQPKGAPKLPTAKAAAGRIINLHVDACATGEMLSLLDSGKGAAMLTCVWFVLGCRHIVDSAVQGQAWCQ